MTTLDKTIFTIRFTGLHLLQQEIIQNRDWYRLISDTILRTHVKEIVLINKTFNKLIIHGRISIIKSHGLVPLRPIRYFLQFHSDLASTNPCYRDIYINISPPTNLHKATFLLYLQPLNELNVLQVRQPRLL